MTKKYKTSFEINKLISISGLFSKIKLTMSSRLVLRSIADYWNYSRGEAFPVQTTLARNTGLSERSVRAGINELVKNQLISKLLIKNRYYYKFSGIFFRLLDLKQEDCIPKGGSRFSHKGESASDNNIIKYNKNTSFNNSFSDEDFDETETEEEFDDGEAARIRINAWKDNPFFARQVDKLREKYNIYD